MRMVDPIDITAAIAAALRFSADAIYVATSDGVVTLDGRVEWPYQRARAEVAVRRLPGVTKVINRISVEPETPPGEIRRKLAEAFRQRGGARRAAQPNVA